MTTKTTTVLYWISTIIFAGLMIFSSIPHITASEEAVKVMHDFLGYPVYFIKFLGLVKIVGSIAILIPGLKKIKEWAYAGLFFDLGGAIYSGIAVSGTVDPMMLTLLIWIVPGIVSYVLWSKRMNG